MTWFVRADGQLESMLGTTAYLLETYAEFWESLTKSGHEIAWHPHLYRHSRPDDAVNLITEPHEAQDELERLWSQLKDGFHPTAFRNGEGWHIPETYATVERFGFGCDSTAIPGRRGANGHPMNWENAPNHPYYPHSADLCRRSISSRPMLEIPMNTWLLQGPDDPEPRTRYMNPAVHPHLFANAVESWENACNDWPAELYLWVMIFHPDEVLPSASADRLYSRSVPALCQNLASCAGTLREAGHIFEWTTISDAAERWKINQRTK